MKKNIFIICLVSLIFGTAGINSAQNIYAGLTGSYARLLAPENYTKKIEQDGLDLNNGFEIGTKLRFNLKNSPLSLSLQLNYARFSGFGASDHVAPPAS